MSNIDPNQETLSVYANSYQHYINNTPKYITGTVVRPSLVSFTSYLEPNSKILEIGSGHGRDAKYFESQGHRVVATDATMGFVTYLKSLGLNAKILNILTDSVNDQYDAVYMSAVLHHFTTAQAEIVLEKLQKSLTGKGIIGLLTRFGEGNEWSERRGFDKRYYRYWTPDSLSLLTKSLGFELLWQEKLESENVPEYGISHDDFWTLVIVRKQ